MNKLYALLLLFLIYSCAGNHNKITEIDFFVGDDITHPKHYIISYNTEDLLIDGLDNEKAWAEAKYTDEFIDIEGELIPQQTTKVKMLWDEDYLYVFAQLKEKHIWGDLDKRDAIIYLNNDFEVFLDPSSTGTNYVEIEINPLGTILDLSLNKPYRVGGKANLHWNLTNLKTAVNISGSLNDHSDIDSLWTVEMAIPINALIELKNKPKSIPKEGEQWKINFSRVEWEFEIIDGKYQRKKLNDKLLPENNWVWSPQRVINMHEPEKWGILQFTNESSSKDIKFIENKDAHIEQIAYSLFRQTRYGSLKYLNNLNFGEQLVINAQLSDIKSIKAYFFKTNMGFEYKIASTISNVYYLINQDGFLKIIK